MIQQIKTAVLSMILISFASCAGTIKTTSSPDSSMASFKKVYIISTEESKYIKFKFGRITPIGYLPPIEDRPPVNQGTIGNTAEVIKKELEKYGIEAVLGKKGDTPEGFDLVIEYNDTWRWDFKKVLDRLEIILINSDGKEIAKSIYTIHRNKEMHNFPTPEKEVPKMIKLIFNRLSA